ncbi:hypothetical protein T8A63_07460 [Sulfitobacter sp. OXR-159]|uniref:hypothetical protein n=1 Tax=Sulfitobacter sp. OXR-159 TaxID=3100174 RepID=UPI002AC90AD9|nr:hypothetical protein [Sulfitobacter sp. OXR-159]WPZ30793.1 hypothetical protein T8A63_06950 [Sulfitobacter sp. OXR-159]WPZ30894.1 hypothetical protein T8A63_07460 [Sulfitobacter sp. OXR-159]
MVRTAKSAPYLGNVGSCNTFISFEFRDLTVVHVYQDSDKTTWENAFFTGTGDGGGRKLMLVNVAVYGFDRIINNIGTVNFDTTRAERCDFLYGGTFYYGRSSQSVNNSFEHCSFFQLDALVDGAGLGNTSFIVCNIVIDGPWLKLYGANGLFGPNSTYIFDGCKGEPWNNGHSYAGGARSSLVKLYGDTVYIRALIKFRDCGFTSSLGFDTSTDYPQIEMTPKMRIEWDGGMLDSDAKIKLHPIAISATGNKDSHFGLFFKGLRQAPDPDQITYAGTPTNSATYPQVTWEWCNDLPNMTVLYKGVTASTLSFAPTVDRAEHTNCMNSGSHSYGILTFGSDLVHELDFFGHGQEVVDVAVSVTYKGGADDLKIETSLDGFSTVLDTFYVSGANGSYRMPISKASAPVSGGKVHDWASLADGSQQSTTVTVLGAEVGDEVLAVSIDSALSGTRMWGEVTATDTVTVYHRNDTGAAVDVSSGTISATVRRASTVVGKVGDDTLSVRCSGPQARGHIYATIRSA